MKLQYLLSQLLKASRKATFATLLLTLACTCVRAQQFSGGFRAGLNFISFEGDAETDADGMTLETFNRTTGFHVGATFAYQITDLFGFKADLMWRSPR